MPAIVPSSWGAGRVRRVREYNDCHEPAGRATGGRFCDADGVPSRGAASQGDDFDPKRRDTWLKFSDHWHEAPDGSLPYGWREMASDDYTPPETFHKKFKHKKAGYWGGSHSGSYATTGAAAAIMGIAGYNTENRDAFEDLAQAMLEAIHASPGAEETLYHAFQNRALTTFRPGDTMDLPLLAAAGRPETTYAKRSEHERQEGPPVVFVFPKGTKMLAYGKESKSDAQEFGYVYSEAIVAGRFKVTKVETKYFGSMHSETPHDPGHTAQLYGQVVYLEPIGYFNTDTGEWDTRG